MANIVEGSVITESGLKLISKLLAAKGKLELTRVVIGEGSLPEDTSPELLTKVQKPIMEAEITELKFNGDGEATIVVQISSDGIAQGFFISEIGVYAQDPDVGEVLYAYVPLQEHPEWMRPENSSICKMITINIVIIVSRVENVVAQISPNVLATVTQLKELEARLIEFEENMSNDAESIVLADGTSVEEAIADKASKADLEQYAQEIQGIADDVNQRFIELITTITGEITLTPAGWVEADSTTYPKHAGWYQQRWPAEDDDERIWQGQSPDAMPDPRDVAAAGKAGAMQVAAHDGYATFFASKKPLAEIRIETLRLIDAKGAK